MGKGTKNNLERLSALLILVGPLIGYGVVDVVSQLF